MLKAHSELHYTYDEYKNTRDSMRDGPKLEFRDGVIYAMTGSTLAHAELISRLDALLQARVKPPCRVLSSSINYYVEATGLAAYPDLSILCGEPKTKRGDSHAFLNPTVLVEVLSESTQDFDRGQKLDDYKQIQSIRAILLVSQWEPEVTLIERLSNGWQETKHDGLSAIVQLPHPRVRLTLRRIFQGIKLTKRER